MDLQLYFFPQAPFVHKDKVSEEPNDKKASPQFITLQPTKKITIPRPNNYNIENLIFTLFSMTFSVKSLTKFHKKVYIVLMSESLPVKW